MRQKIFNHFYSVVIEKGVTEEQTTARIWREVASSITKGIKFTVEMPEDHDNGMVPILDVQARLTREDLGLDPDGEMVYQDKVEHMFYKKPTANWLLVQEMGALPSRAKFSTLSAEVTRRLRNSSKEIGDQEKASILTNFAKAMQSSGYGDIARAEAIWSGIKGHRNTTARREAGDIPESDQAWETRGRRQIRKMQEKSNWFQKKSKNQGGEVETGTSWRHNNNKRDRGPPTTTLYVPATPDGEMARRLQEADLKFSDLHQQGWIKIIERGGTKLKDMVTNKYPWAEVSCRREDCCSVDPACTSPQRSPAPTSPK